MVLLIAGSTHTGKTLLAQRVLEERGWPYLSLDHLKMGLIRSGLTSLMPDSPDKELTALLWPVAREMIKTAIENGQNLVVEGCYIPCDFTKDFVPYYLDQLRAIWLIFSRRYIWERFDQILAYGGTIERRLDPSLDREALEPGRDCYAQLRMTEDLATKPGDRFVIRFYSPLETIGGGVVLDDNPRRHKAGDPAVLESLAIKESGSGAERLIQAVAEGGQSLPTLDKLAVQLNMDREELKRELEDLCSAGKLLEPLPGRYLALSVLDGLWDGCQALLEKYHRDNPLHAGMKVAELRQKLMKTADQTVADAILAELVRERKLKQVADRYALADFSVHLTKRQNAIRERLLKQYSQAGLETPGLDEVYAGFAANEQTDCKQVVESLVTSGELIMLTPQICIHPSVYLEVCRRTKEYLDGHETLALADFRDMLSTSRKYALAVLEYFDKNKILKKDGDLRRVGLGFRELLPEEP